MKIFITGSDGNIGRYFSKYFSSKHQVFNCKTDFLDITNKVKCIETIKNATPDIVIHCAALTNIDLCERDESTAYTVNTIGSLNIAYCCSMLNIPIIYLSCNYVYDGNKSGIYYETDLCTPINVYGRTKLAGEQLIRTMCSKYFIIRTSWVFGGKNCFVKNIIENKEASFFISTTEIASPTYIKDLCSVIETILSSDIYGIYNCVNLGAVKKSLMIKTSLSYLKIKKDIIEIPEEHIPNKALLPKCTIMDTSLLKNCFNINMRTWEAALLEYLDK
ncbi:NAD(P)-dependent oxidoreductase [Clostridium swellfunianum]|uniref:SDR family oxidoreductase n=1 Tax=Clostridium swellfunianum TaxID=1367462 RepID=UPI0020308F91|nr:NAD(P)-dependent oxidoreductase [Clostridium swellfunianum]MCM0648467.1 NAD(P)-dependent oxidoreductase [Clostridium swellfunianum]